MIENEKYQQKFRDAPIYKWQLKESKPVIHIHMFTPRPN